MSVPIQRHTYTDLADGNPRSYGPYYVHAQAASADADNVGDQPII